MFAFTNTGGKIGMEKFFTLKTKKGSWHLLWLFVGIMLFFAFLSNMISTNFYRVTHTKVVFDVSSRLS